MEYIKMKCATLLTLLFVGLVTGDGAWESNKVYRYKLVAGTLKSLPQSNNEFVGVFSRAYLTIRPQSKDLLIGQITQAEYGKVNQKLYDEWISDLEDRKLENWPLDKPFKIHLENGVIRSLSVDDSMTNYEINQLKVIVSQFQIDTNAQNKIDFSDNQLPGKDKTNAFYKTMEPIVTGNCETDYEISPIPDYLLQSNPEWIPLPELGGTGQFMIVKTRSNSNCHETSDYLLDIAGRNDFKTNGHRKNDLYLIENRRIVISGDLKAYTIQSSITFNTVINGRDNNNPPLTDYINVTLQSVEDSGNTQTEFRYENVVNLKNIGNLVYTYDSDANTAPMKVKLQSQLFATSSGYGDLRLSNCWTAFPTASTICKSEFGPEYEGIKTQNCGFLGLGKQVHCRMSFPGCRDTVCYSVFISRSELCYRTFGNEFPVTKGGFEDCTPGFYRSRCCPQTYE